MRTLFALIAAVLALTLAGCGDDTSSERISDTSGNNCPDWATQEANGFSTDWGYYEYMTVTEDLQGCHFGDAMWEARVR